jgi:hypothetical protein
MFAALGRWTVPEEILIVPGYGQAGFVVDKRKKEGCEKEFTHSAVIETERKRKI